MRMNDLLESSTFLYVGIIIILSVLLTNFIARTIKAEGYVLRLWSLMCKHNKTTEVNGKDTCSCPVCQLVITKKRGRL